MVGVASDDPSSTITSSYGRSPSEVATRLQNSAASPSSSSIGATTLSRRSSRADMVGGSVEPPLRSGAVTPVLGNILQPLIDFFHWFLEFFHDDLGLRLGHVDHRADRAGAGGPAPRHLQVVEVDDPAAAARAADEGDAEEVQAGPAAPAAGDDEVLPRELGQPVRLLPADDRAAAGVPGALLHAAGRPPAATSAPGVQDGPGEADPLRRDARVELPLHPRPDRQGHGLRCSSR